MLGLLLAACLLCAGCASATDRSQQSTPPLVTGSPITSASRAAPGPSREPATLAVLPEEAAVVAALDAAGITLTHIGSSKFESLLGEPQRARVFIERTGAGGAGADVLFLDHPIPDLRVCASKAASGLNRFQVFIGDQLMSDGEGAQNISFSVSDRYFVFGIGEAFGEALMKGLGTRRPSC